MATKSGIAVLNNLQRKVVMDITDSRFTNIFGVLIASDNIVERCYGSPDLTFSLIHMSHTVYRLSFDNKVFLTIPIYTKLSLFHFGSLNETVSFSNIRLTSVIEE